ncbi:PAS domain S-box protein [Methanocalculus taiwanensis]|uniref:histidine kinase n=1 Tax=Methanocalculus taiwanensis TaxID=106207 RepID=A0ABD4TH75_9EURY|nr:PAS domain S-box protein [Methanocalculus taiwanensis]MCQ1537851.1 PAS domain S-box protein [Methanocalculus taiwanensis]
MPTPAADEPRISLLYVDDEPALLEIARLFLERTGNYSVSTCDNPHDALKIISQDSFDAIISDYQMPECDGISFLRYLRKIGNKTPFIIFTGKGREEVVIQALNEGADFYLQKGGDPKSQFAELSNKVRYAVARKRGEEALQGSEERYRAIFEHTEAPTVILEEDTSISLVNSAFAEISGYSQEELIGRSWTEFVSKPDLDRMLAHHRARREEGADAPTRYEFTFLNRHGEAHEISLTVGMIPGTRQSVASFHDLTDVKLGEKAVRESEERYRRIVDTSAEGIWQLDPLFRITYVNRQMAEMLGYSPDEMIGMDANSFIPPDEQADVEMRKAGVRRGEVEHFERRFIRRDESSLWAQVALTPIIDADGVYQGSFAMITNITDRKAAEEELRKLALVVKYSSELINLSSADGRMIFLNEAGSRMLGISPDNVEQHLIWDVIPEKLQQLVQNELLPALIEKSTWEGNLQYRNLMTNALTDVHAQCFGIRDEKTGAPLFMANVSLDITDQKAAEEALLQKNEELTAAEEELRQQLEKLEDTRRAIEEREEQLRTVSNNIPGGIVYRIVTDPAGNRRFIYVSAAIERILGITQAEALDDVQKVYGLVLDEDREKLIEAEEMAIRTLDPFISEVRFQKPDSTIRCVQIQSALKELPDGSIIGDGIILDITDRKAAEVALRESEERYHSLFDQSMEGVYLHDPQGRILDINRMACIQSGYSREEWLERTIFDGHPESSRLNPPKDEIIRKWREWEPGQRFFFESVHQRKDGTIYPVEISTGLVRYGNQDAFLAIVRDITERKAAEQRLVESENRFRVLFEGSPQGILVADAGTKQFLYANPAICSMLGYSEDELAGLGVPDIHPEESLESVASEFESLVRAEKTLAPDIPCLRKDKTVFYADIHAGAIVIEGRNLFVAFFEDITERKAAEAVLRESEQRYREIFNSVNNAIWIHDISTFRFVYANTTVEELFGYTPDESVGLKISAISSNEPPFTEETGIAFLKKAASGEPQIFDWHCRHKDGHLFWSEINLRRGTIAGKEYIFAIHRDITDRKAAEEAIRKNEERFSRAIAATGAGLWDWDMINDRVFYSHQWKSMLGYDDHEIENTFSGWKSLWHPDDASRIERAVNDYLEGRTKSYEVEHRLRHKDGSWRWILTRGDIERDAERRPVRWTGTNIDITEQKTQSEELENFFRVNLDLLCIADLEGNFIKINETWSAILGYSTEELNKRKFLEFVHPDDMQATLDTIACLGQGEDVLNFTNRYRCKDGSYRSIEWRSHPKGNLIYAAARDITERKAAEEAIQTANKKLQLLSSITRHDILNKIMTLQGYLDLAMPEIHDPRLSRYLSEADKAATAIQTQIDFTKVYQTLGVHAPTWQPLSPLIEAIDDSELPIQHDCGEFAVYADPMLEKVLHNLYDNTIRHAEGADCVSIRCEERDSDLIIIWEDNGPGIPDEQKKRIFDKGVGKNTGLGLFLSREILSITGIAISETGVYGEGARFEISVPAGGFRVA